jgi:hypothetical protein
MKNVDRILRDSILQVCGPQGATSFTSAYPASFDTGNNSPDLESISRALASLFSGDAVTAILSDFGERLEEARRPGRDETGRAPQTLLDRLKQRGKAAVEESSIRKMQEESLKSISPEQIRMELAARLPGTLGHDAAETRAGEPAGPVDEATASFAREVNADPRHVQDIVFEARRLRTVMGKEGLSAEADARDGKAGEAGAASAPATPEPLDEEVARFVQDQSACSCIAIIDFIRYLKDKGYSIQERTVLEKIYVKIEERKKEAREAVKKEVETLIDGTSEPSEPQIASFIQRLGDTGLIYEEDDVRRMIRTAALRRASQS